MGGTFKNLKLVSSPARAVAIGGSSLTVSGITVDNSAGAAEGANTDGFDVSANDVTIESSTVTNQGKRVWSAIRTVLEYPSLQTTASLSIKAQILSSNQTLALVDMESP